MRLVRQCTAFVVLLSGCSAVSVRPYESPTGAPKRGCTDTYSFPIMDTVGALAFSTVGLVLLFTKQPRSGFPQGDQAVAIVGTQVIAGLFAISGIYGYANVAECRSPPTERARDPGLSKDRYSCVEACDAQKAACKEDWNTLMQACVRRAGLSRPACVVKFGPYICDDEHDQCVAGC